MNISNNLKAIYNCLQDDESRTLFIAKVNHFFTNEPRYWHDMIESALLFGSGMKRKFDSRFPLLDDFINIPDYKEKDVALYGAGFSLELVLPVLQRFNINIRAICDSNIEKQGKIVHGYSVISPEKLTQEHKECYIMVTGFFGAGSIVQFLLNAGFSANRIISLVNIEEMYFGPEFIIPKEDEFYIDVGLHNIKTIKDFIRFCDTGNVKYKKILGLEPDKECYENCVNAIGKLGYKNVEIIKKGAYSSKGIIKFDGDKGGISKIDENGSDAIEVVTIDELICDDDIVTFIKMDIEGAELEALKGVAKTIRRNKPRLAISIYHKPEDIIDILSYINSLVPEYRFWIRQYSYFGGETVLYALV